MQLHVLYYYIMHMHIDNILTNTMRSHRIVADFKGFVERVLRM